MTDDSDQTLGRKIPPSWPPPLTPPGWEPIPGLARSTRHPLPDQAGWIYSVTVPPNTFPSPPFFVRAPDYQLTAGIAEVLVVLNQLLQGQTTMSGSVNNIDTVLSTEQADVAALVAATNTLITMVQGFPAAIAAAVAAAVSAGATPEQVAAFGTLSAAMEAETASAVAAATAAAPPAAP